MILMTELQQDGNYLGKKKKTCNNYICIYSIVTSNLEPLAPQISYHITLISVF